MRATPTYAAVREGMFGENALTENRSQPPAQPPGAKLARKPGPLGAAEARLEAALDRLEIALDGWTIRAEKRAEERGQDRAALSRLQDENAALQQIRADVSGRLDAAIQRLGRALAH